MWLVAASTAASVLLYSSDFNCIVYHCRAVTSTATNQEALVWPVNASMAASIPV